MIFIDTETTGLLNPSANDLKNQPEIIEFYGIKLDDEFQIIGDVNHLIKPSSPISEEITKITGITNEMLEGKPSFPQVFDEIYDLFFDDDHVIAHNCYFDMNMLINELRRMEMEFKFPYPRYWTCTVEKTFHLFNKRLTLNNLHYQMTEKQISNAHRAKDDVYALIRCYHQMIEKGIV